MERIVARVKQPLADRQGLVHRPVLVDVSVHFFSSRPCAAWAKKALADFRISLARRSSLFSRSSALRRSRSSVVTPSRAPLSISWRLTTSQSASLAVHGEVKRGFILWSRRLLKRVAVNLTAASFKKYL